MKIRINNNNNYFKCAPTLLVLTCLINGINGLIMRGFIQKSTDWLLIGKYCLISADSRFQFTFTYPRDYLTQNLLLYYDTQWDNVYEKAISCEDKENWLSTGQKIPLDMATRKVLGGYLCSYDSTNTTLTCSDYRGFISSRPRYWFVVVDNCQQTKGLTFTYDVQFTNGPGVFRHHFSADEFGIFECSIAFFLTYFLMIILSIVFAKLLFNKSLLHATFKLFLASIIFQFLNYLFYMSEYAQFSSSGIWTPGMLTTARLFEAIAQTIFLFLLILLAKGYTVTRGKLRLVTKIKLTVFFSVYILTYIAVFIYSEVSFDLGKINYFYGSPPAVGIVCLKLIFGWVWFIYSIFFTIKNYPEKRKFYIVYLILFSLWFVSGPFVLMCCSYLVADWVKQFVAFITSSSVSLVGHLFFLFLTRPTKGNKLFPYHVKTNQIVCIPVSADNEKQNFPHHAETEGGNVNFNETFIGLSDLFTVKNNGDKYVTEMTDVTGSD